MTKEQHEQLQDLIYKIQRIVYYAGEAYIPYELAAAISRADEVQGECNQFIMSLMPSDPTTGQQEKPDGVGAPLLDAVTQAQLLQWQTYCAQKEEIKQLRGELSLAEEGLANYAQEVQRLQRALNFWLPGMPAHELPPELEKRLEDDIALLAGYDGEVEPEAEQRGWITLNAEPQPDKHGA